MSTPPATMSASPGAAPWLGTHVTLFASTPSDSSQPASPRCQMPPCPVPDALNVPAGCSLIAVSRSSSVWYSEVGRDHDAARIGVDQREDGIVLIGQLGQALMVHHGDLDRHDAERVAVRLGGRDGAVADHARPAGAVDDVDRLAELAPPAGWRRCGRPRRCRRRRPTARSARSGAPDIPPGRPPARRHSATAKVRAANAIAVFLSMFSPLRRLCERRSPLTGTATHIARTQTSRHRPCWRAARSLTGKPLLSGRFPGWTPALPAASGARRHSMLRRTPFQLLIAMSLARLPLSSRCRN